MIRRDDVLYLLVDADASSANGEVARCAIDFEQSKETRPLSVRKWLLPALTKLQRVVPDEEQTALVMQCLRVYHARRAEPDVALAEVYAWARCKAPSLYPTTLRAKGESLGVAERKLVAAKCKAAELYADCFLVFAEFVAAWSTRQIGVA